MALRQAGKYIEDEELLAAHAAARTARLRCEAPTIGKVECKFYPKFTIFFDGTMNNLNNSPDNKSNVARLFLTAYRDRGAEFYPRYITGVGTEYEPKDNPEVGVDKGGSMGAGFGKGGDMRLKDAILFIEKTLGKNYTTAMSHIKMLRVNVIGFSRGATLARAFINKLLNEKSGKDSEGKLIYKLDYYGMTVPLEIGFLGLFDTVASVGGPQLHADWASDLRVPPSVKRCVHLVAAHEVRKAFPLDSIQYQNKYPENSEEVVYPGVHSDVGGGYYPNEQGRSLEYTKIPLREMYLEALKAGVGLQSLIEMSEKNKKEYIPTDQDALVEKYKSYMEYVKAPADNLVSAVQGHRPVFFRWHADVERSGNKTRLFTGLAKEADCSACLSAPAERIKVEKNEKMWASRKLKDATGQGKELVTEHKRLVSRIPFIKDPYERVGNENVDRPRTDYEELIYSAWTNPNPLPKYISEFFEEYVHDSVAAFDSWPCALYDPRKIFMHEDTVMAQITRPDTDAIA
ncbi:T6SS phospholipase effector Tle1-like catalytic domain-containing protein [Chromobacterium violaceum]|uniref:T6SS Phospholipase effector Tle1-like catalytic domain-containing protein n=1 Tax=Chromobacterium violaceum TaxID=536 RepID=A0A202B7N4_CHRVL|nr:DUF2235 domain-containing protein [Chromobacterium violaceum]OVE47593.1 hypothetical protein CBW21_13065 [Chromobacterium violaceum]